MPPPGKLIRDDMLSIISDRLQPEDEMNFKLESAC